MLFPESPRTIYGLNPIKEVICQLRFPTILEIAASEPAAFQKQIRSVYPIYQREEPPIQVPKEIAALLPIHAGGVTHKFLTEDSSRVISLATEFVAVSETRYTEWEAFRTEIERAKQAVEAIYEPSFYGRIGLRYQDVIRRSALHLDGEDWRELVRPELTGFLAEASLKDHVQEAQSQVLLKLGEGESRFVRIRHGLIKTPEDGELAYLIDIDLYAQGRSAGEDVADTLELFHRVAGNLFRWAITKRLADALRPVGVAERTAN